MTYIEKLYSEAFEDGVDYAVQKMYMDPSLYDIAEEGAKAAEADVAAAKAAGKEAAKKEGLLKRVWKSKLGKAGIIGTAAAGLGYGGYKLYKNRQAKKEAEATKNYSDAFMDGVDYAIQRLYANAHQAEQEEKNAKNWKGAVVGAAGDPVTYLIGRNEINKALREGKSDDDVKAAGRKVAKISGGIKQGVGAAALGTSGGIIGHTIGGKKGAAIGAVLGGGLGLGAGTVGKKIDQWGIDKNADEAIRRRKKVREERGAGLY